MTCRGGLCPRCDESQDPQQTRRCRPDGGPAAARYVVPPGGPRSTRATRGSHQGLPQERDCHPKMPVFEPCRKWQVLTRPRSQPARKSIATRIDGFVRHVSPGDGGFVRHVFRRRRWVRSSRFPRRRWVRSSRFPRRRWVCSSRFPRRRWVRSSRFPRRRWVRSSRLARREARPFEGRFDRSKGGSIVRREAAARVAPLRITILHSNNRASGWRCSARLPRGVDFKRRAAYGVPRTQATRCVWCPPTVNSAWSPDATE